MSVYGGEIKCADLYSPWTKKSIGWHTLFPPPHKLTYHKNYICISYRGMVVPSYCILLQSLIKVCQNNIFLDFLEALGTRALGLILSHNIVEVPVY